MTHKRSKRDKIAEVVEVLEKIEAKEMEVENSSHALDAQREATKTAKGVWLTKISELQELIRTRKRWAEEAKRQPLFNQPRADAGQDKWVNHPSSLAETDRPATVAAQQTGEQGEGESADWRKTGLKALRLHSKKITHKDVEQLEDAGIPTLGLLAERMEAMGESWAKGFRWGDVRRQAIEDALGAIRAASEKPEAA